VSVHRSATFRMLTDPDERVEAEQLLRGAQVAIGSPADPPSGSVVLGAFDRERLIGAVTSHVAPDESERARVDQDRLHVTALAVEASASGRGIGGKLMRLQRLLALRRGLRLATWEQDSLDGRLAHLAIHRLGAVSRRIIGSTEGGHGWRLDIEWWVSSPRVQERLTGGRPELDLAHALEAGAPKLNAGRLDDQGLLHPTGGDAPPSTAAALVEVPCDVRAMQQRDPSLAVDWREHVARILSQAFGQGYWLTDYLWLRGERVPRAYFLLIDGERTLG
jgi:chorismate synthase